MKVFLVVEVTRDDLDWDCRHKIFSTEEKAIKYLEERNKDLYYNYDVEYWLKEDKENTKYDKTEDSVSYYDNNGGYEIAIHEEEVK